MIHDFWPWIRTRSDRKVSNRRGWRYLGAMCLTPAFPLRGGAHDAKAPRWDDQEDFQGLTIAMPVPSKSVWFPVARHSPWMSALAERKKAGLPEPDCQLTEGFLTIIRRPTNWTSENKPRPESRPESGVESGVEWGGRVGNGSWCGKEAAEHRK